MTSSKRYGITFLDLDETLFKTFAKIKVMKDGKLLKSLTNKEFNTYKLNEGESFDFSEFDDAELFKETSIPIKKIVDRIKKMIVRIKETKSISRIILLTARGDFVDKEIFLSAFTKQGIDVSNKNIFYIERAGNSHEGSIAERKRKIVLKYLMSGLYTKCRMLDDDLTNLQQFLALENALPQELISEIRKRHSMKANQKPILFYAIHVDEEGNINRIQH